MASKPIIVYAASGYTGSLVGEQLAEMKQPFVAAGRNHCVEDKINKRGYVSIAQAFGARNFLEKIKRIVTKVEVS